MCSQLEFLGTALCLVEPGVKGPYWVGVHPSSKRLCVGSAQAAFRGVSVLWPTDMGCPHFGQKQTV